VGVKQRKSQEELAFMSSAEVKPKAEFEEGTETPTAGSKAESQAGKEQLMEVILEPENASWPGRNGSWSAGCD